MKCERTKMCPSARSPQGDALSRSLLNSAFHVLLSTTVFASLHTCADSLAFRREWFLCATTSGQCEPDEEFSDYYGRPVYLCENVHW